jgi:hypothetical protein
MKEYFNVILISYTFDITCNYLTKRGDPAETADRKEATVVYHTNGFRLRLTLSLWWRLCNGQTNGM